MADQKSSQARTEGRAGPSFATRLASFQTRYAAYIILVSVALAGVSLLQVQKLGLNSAWTALLPDSQPSVVDLERVRGRMGGLSSLSVVLQSSDTEALKAFGEQLATRLQERKIPRLWSVEWNVREYQEFLEQHRYLYLDRSALAELRDDLQQSVDHERLSRNPFYVDLSDDTPPTPQELLDRFKRRRDEQRAKSKQLEDGFFLHPDGNLLVLFVRTDLGGGDYKGTQALLAAIEREAKELGPTQFAKDMRIEFAGSILHARQEHDAIQGELITATALTIGLVLIAVLGFFRRFRALPLLGFSMVPSVLLTFALTQPLVGSLNTSTAFLGSIVIGNGVNPLIIWLARYFEERGRAVEPTDAIAATHRSTWVATMVASGAAAIAYGSLVITDFRGFRDFGIIGGTGMVLAWLGAYLLLPAWTVVAERIRPLRFRKARKQSIYGRLFFRLASSHPGAWLVTALALTAVALAAVTVAVIRDPLEYDFNKLRSVREKAGRVSQLNARINEFMPKSGSGNAIVLLTDTTEQAKEIKALLNAKREATPEKERVFGPVRTISDLLPPDQTDKRKMLAEVRQLMLEVRKYAKPSAQDEIDELMVPEVIERVGIQDLPEGVARAFTERDGTRGRIVLVEDSPAFSTWDGRYLIAWANELRATRLDDGFLPAVVGRAPVFADMIAVVLRDGPRAVLASFAATVLLLLVSFRRVRYLMLTLAALLLGIVWMAGSMALAGMKLNFLNFVAFPITFGNGVDYGVNIVRRFAFEEGAAEASGAKVGSSEERSGVSATNAVRAAVEGTGGAVTLCSLTTIIGYLSLYVSSNLALNSFGAAMAISEVTCLLSAVLTVPAWLLWRASRNERRSRQAALAATSN